MTEEQCRQALNRIAWRLQYRVNKVLRKETILVEEISETTASWCQMSNVESDLFVEEILSFLPDKGKLIIQQVVIYGISEKEVAKKLNVSQQRVNTYKRKYLQILRSKLTSAGKER